MSKKIKKEECCESECSCDCSSHKWHHHTKSGGIYCLGFIVAAIYFISNSTGFWMGVLGILKALVWPAMLVYNLLKFLGM
jgi:hypothetical protein